VFLLVDQQQRQQEAAELLPQESVRAYMEFMNSMFAAPQAAAQEGGRGGRRQANPEVTERNDRYGRPGS
jgi:hypothetical protein